MDVWTIKAKLGFVPWIIPDDPKVHTWLTELLRTGAPFGDAYRTIHTTHDREGSVEFFHLDSGMLVCTHEAFERLKDLFSDDVEVLPLDIFAERACLLNVTRVNNCLDLDKSTISYFPNGKVKSVDKYVFTSDLVEGCHVFRIPQELETCVFCTDEFRAKMIERGVTDLEFEEPAPLLPKIGELARMGFRPPLEPSS